MTKLILAALLLGLGSEAKAFPSTTGYWGNANATPEAYLRINANGSPVPMATLGAVPIQGGNGTPVTVQAPLGDLTPIYGVLSINTTPSTVGTPDPKVVVLHWGYIATFGGGGTVSECNSTGTPGAVVSGVETYLTNPAVVQAQHWLISTNGTPTSRGYTIWRRP